MTHVIPWVVGSHRVAVSHARCHTFPVFSEEVLDHFHNPRNIGELSDASATVEVNNPVCGDVLRLAIQVSGERIDEVRFLCRGCTTSIACASLLTERLRHSTLSQARGITAQELSLALGGLPLATFHGAQLAHDALRAILKSIDPLRV